MWTIIKGAALPLAFLAATAADATVLDFNGLMPGATFTSTTANGFTVTALTDLAYPTTPSTQTFLSVGVGGTVADPYLALGQGPRGIDITGPGQFTLGAFAYTRTFPADNDVQQLTVTGYLNGVAVFTRSYMPGTNWPSGTIATPTGGYESILVDRVRFQQDGFHSGTLDSINVNAVTSAPEPADWALMTAGFGLLGGVLRRRRIVATGMA